MDLYLLRHGVAADAPPPGGTDFDRALTPAGLESMRASAQGMRRLGIELDALCSSPLVRTRETAALVAAAFGYNEQIDDRLAPGLDLHGLRTVLGGYGAGARVMLVGHEPDLSTLVETLTGARVEMKKGMLAVINLAGVARGAGVLRSLLPPRVLRALDGAQ